MNAIDANAVGGARADMVAERFAAVRARTEALAAPLSPEDQTVQSMPDASPAKWHRAHTTWFFETFLLLPHLPGYARYREEFGFLFNSYYEAAGPRHARPKRGMLTRPSSAEVAAYRAHVDAAMAALMRDPPPGCPLRPDRTRPAARGAAPGAARHRRAARPGAESPLSGLRSGMARAGHDARAGALPRRPDGRGGDRPAISDGRAGFAFDNETPRHRVFLAPFRIADRLVSNGEWLAFMRDGGYRTPTLWMSDGWAAAQAEGWDAPLYWREAEEGGGAWRQFTLGGLAALGRGGAGPAHLLVRGRRLRPLVGQAPAHGRGMGGGRRPARLPRRGGRRLAVDRAAPTGPIRASVPGKARWASTTASSW